MSSKAPPLPDLSKNGAMKKRGQLALIIGMVGIIAVLIIPLPTFMLDLLITVNVTASILIMMATLAAASPLELSTFPSILLLATLLRLALNVASTRVVLLNGHAGPGAACNVIQAFGDFVDRRQLRGRSRGVRHLRSIIKFVVITKGAGRIAEVSARFTLDAMPGKQMAIDADLNAGLIGHEDARKRRQDDLEQEADFYGAMDGASKFVRGDAVAGILITDRSTSSAASSSGRMQHDLSFRRCGADLYAPDDRGRPRLADPRPHHRCLFGHPYDEGREQGRPRRGDGGPGPRPDQHRPDGGRRHGRPRHGPRLPTVPFMILGGALLIASARGSQAEKEAQERDEAQEGEPEEVDEEQRIEDLLHVDRLGIEIGYRLISIVDPGRHGGLLEHIASLRRQFVSQLGLVVPPIRVKDNIQLGPNTYRILLMGQEIASGEVHSGQYLAMDPTGSAPAIEGKETVEPAFGLPARWITEGQKEHAEMLGYTVIEAPSVLVTHLTEVLRSVSHELLSREDVQALLENAKKAAPTVVDEVVPGVLSTSQVQRVLADLLKERVSVRNLPLILESLGDAAAETKEHRHLVESVRSRVARAIVEPYLDAQSILPRRHRRAAARAAASGRRHRQWTGRCAGAGCAGTVRRPNSTGARGTRAARSAARSGHARSAAALPRRSRRWCRAG
jgi:flagellar biosynthesis protein FlhA